MAKSRSAPLSKANLPRPRTDGDGNELANLILLRIARTECPSIFPSLEFVRLKLHQVLHESGEVIRSVYFGNTGLASVLAVQPDGKSIEVGLIGNEGFVGIPIVFGFKTSATRVVAQSDGTAYRIDADTLRKLLPKCPKLALTLQRFGMILGSQTTQLAACNGQHDAHERLARWLLMSQDRIGGKILPLTQEFLSQML